MDEADRVIWAPDSISQFSVKSSFSQARSGSLTRASPLAANEWKKFWALKIQQRLKLLFWKVIVDVLPLRTKNFRFIPNMPEEALACPLCKQTEETVSHLFLGCLFSRVLWREGPWPFNPAPFCQEPLVNWVRFVLNPNNKPHRDREN